MDLDGRLKKEVSLTVMGRSRALPPVCDDKGARSYTSSTWIRRRQKTGSSCWRGHTHITYPGIALSGTHRTPVPPAGG
jgi:hypothetical protein